MMRNLWIYIVIMILCFGFGLRADPTLMTTTLEKDGTSVQRFLKNNKEIARLILRGDNTVVRSGEIPDGIVREYYDNGKVKVEKNFLNNFEEGLSRVYYPNGNPEFDVNYKMGIYDGMTREFFMSGKLAAEISYKKGKLNGYWREYYENEQLKSEKYFIDGKWNWTANYYDEKGNLTESTSYVDNRETSSSRKEYYPNGNVKYNDFYDSGIRVHREAYDEAGNLLYNKNY